MRDPYTQAAVPGRCRCSNPQGLAFLGRDVDALRLPHGVPLMV